MSELNGLEVSGTVEDVKIEPFELLVGNVLVAQPKNYLHTKQQNNNKTMST